MLSYPHSVLLTKSPAARKYIGASALLKLTKVNDSSGSSRIEAELIEGASKYEVIECPSNNINNINFALQPPVIFFDAHPEVPKIESCVKRRANKVQVWVELLRLVRDEGGVASEAAGMVWRFLYNDAYAADRDLLLGKIREYSNTDESDKKNPPAKLWGIVVDGFEDWQILSPALKVRLARDQSQGRSACSICGKESALGSKLPDYKAGEIRPYSFNMDPFRSYGRGAGESTPVCVTCNESLAKANVALAQNCHITIKNKSADAYAWDLLRGPSDGALVSSVSSALVAQDFDTAVAQIESFGDVFYMDVIRHDARTSIRYEGQSTGAEIANRVRAIRGLVDPRFATNSKTGERFIGGFRITCTASKDDILGWDFDEIQKSGIRSDPVKVIAEFLASIHGFVDVDKSAYLNYLTAIYRYIYAGEMMDEGQAKRLSHKVGMNNETYASVQRGSVQIEDIRAHKDITSLQTLAINAISRERIDMTSEISPPMKKILINAAYLLTRADKQRYAKTKPQRNLMDIYHDRLRRSFFSTFIDIFPDKGVSIHVSKEDPYLTEGTLERESLIGIKPSNPEPIGTKPSNSEPIGIKPSKSEEFDRELWGGIIALWGTDIKSKEAPPERLTRAEWDMFMAYYNYFHSFPSIKNTNLS